MRACMHAVVCARVCACVRARVRVCLDACKVGLSPIEKPERRTFVCRSHSQKRTSFHCLASGCLVIRFMLCCFSCLAIASQMLLGRAGKGNVIFHQLPKPELDNCISRCKGIARAPTLPTSFDGVFLSVAPHSNGFDPVCYKIHWIFQNRVFQNRVPRRLDKMQYLQFP